MLGVTIGTIKTIETNNIDYITTQFNGFDSFDSVGYYVFLKINLMEEKDPMC